MFYIKIDFREDNKWTVYMHIVPKELSGYEWDKYYVGITGTSVNKRWGLYGTGYGHYNNYFWNAIQKYGWDNVQHEIIAEKLTKDEACKMEIDLIEKLSSNHREYGYNLTNGGDGVSGYQFTEEQIQKMKERKGKNNGFYGKKHTDLSKQKMSENHYDCSGHKNPNAKPIYRFDLFLNFIKMYPSATDAEKELNCKYLGSAALHGSFKANSYWAREDGIFIDDDGIHLKNIPKHNNRNFVFQFDKNMNYINLFTSGNEAGRVNGFGGNTINRCVKNKKLGCGYYWVYKEDVEIINGIPTIKDSIKKQIVMNNTNKQKEE